MTGDDLLLLAVQVACCIFMTGLIWFVQVVHYPLMKLADAGQFEDYSRKHQQQTTWVVAGPMLLELTTAIWLLISNVAIQLSILYLVALFLLIVVWVSTALLQMPLHGQLLKGHDSNTIRRLVITNWIRTVAWSFRSILLGVLLWNTLRPH